MSWPVVEFGEVATIVTGSTPKKVEGNYDGDIPFVTPGDLGIHAEINSSNSTVTEQGAKSGRLLPKGAVLVCCIGATIGKVGIADCELITNQQINSLVFDESKVFPKFGYYFCTSIKPLLIARSSSTTMPIVNKSNFSKFEMPLPPLEEQKRIVAILDKADSVRRKRQKAIDLADDFLRSVFLDMFGDPVSNPKGWEIKALNDISLGKGVYGSGKPAVSYSEGDYRYIRITDITSTGDLKEKKVSLQDSEQESQKYLLEDGDLLFARSGATVGKTFLYSSKYGQCIYAGYLIKFSINRDIALPEFVKAFTDTSIYWNWIKSKQKVVAQPNINAKQYGEELKIPVPPKELQIKFVGIWKKVNESKEKWINSIDGELVQSLSQKAFAGEL